MGWGGAEAEIKEDSKFVRVIRRCQSGNFRDFFVLFTSYEDHIRFGKVLFFILISLNE